MLINEFCKVTGINEEDMSTLWSNVEGCVLRCAAYDDKKGVKSLLASYNTCKCRSVDDTMNVASLYLSL